MAIAKLPPPYNRRLLDVNGAGPGDAALDVTQVPGEQPALGAWLLSIPARARQPELAREFLLFATEKDEMVRAALRGNPPPRRSVLQDPAVQQKYPFFPEQLESLTRARARPRTPHWREIERVLGDCLSALYDNAVTEDEAWERVKQGLDAIRRKQRAIAAAEGPAIRAMLDAPWGEFSCHVDGKLGPEGPSRAP
jgi:multiple sugar transport system substrate-binding protein